MKESEILEIADLMTEEYKTLLHVDPYFKVQIELTDLPKISDCAEADSPATWKLRINPSQHRDEIDVQMSVVSAVLTILFRDIPPSNKLDEVRSKLTHALVQLTASGAEDASENDLTDEQGED